MSDNMTGKWYVIQREPYWVTDALMIGSKGCIVRTRKVNETEHSLVFIPGAIIEKTEQGYRLR